MTYALCRTFCSYLERYQGQGHKLRADRLHSGPGPVKKLTVARVMLQVCSVVRLKVRLTLIA